MTVEYSNYQNAIFAFAADPKAGNAVVKAVAGSGKTTTIVEAMRRVPKGKNQIFLAFSKAIQLELQSRGVNAKTFHALCYGPVTNFWGVKEVDANKMRDLIDANLDGPKARLYGAFVDRLVGLAKNSGIGCLVEDTESAWSALASHHNLELESEEASYAEAIRLSRHFLELSNNSKTVDFNDLLYVVVKYDLILQGYDFVWVDEAQDTNAVRRAILKKVVKGRMVAVGDPAQAIFGFTGADNDSLDLIAKDFSCIELPLTVSYRCASSIVDYARNWVSHIEAAPAAVEGSVVESGEEWKGTDFVANDMVVCRTVAPLVKLAYQLMQDRIPVRMLGKEIGTGMKSLIKKMNPKGIPNLQQKLEVYADREIQKALAKKNETKAEAVRDQVNCVFFLIDTLGESNRTVPALVEVIENLFADKSNAVVLPSIHKSKGLEAHRVYWLNRSRCPSKWARREWQQQQEVNLCYVAATRAKNELILIEEKKK